MAGGARRTLTASPGLTVIWDGENGHQRESYRGSGNLAEVQVSAGARQRRGPS